VPLAEDQDAVGEFGSGREYESIGEAVRSRASSWDLHGVDARTGQGSVERRGELTGPVADEESDAGVRSSRSVRRFRACRVVHAPAGLWRSRPGRSPRPASSRPASAGTVAISYRWTGTVPEVRPQLEDPAYRRRAAAVPELEQFALEALVAQVWFSLAIRSIRAAIMSWMGGRPGRFG
jgi:hypothetical protein